MAQKWAYFFYSWEEWGIDKWTSGVDSTGRTNGDHGPFNSFSEAKRALIKAMQQEILMLAEGIQNVKRYKKTENG